MNPSVVGSGVWVRAVDTLGSKSPTELLPKWFSNTRFVPSRISLKGKPKEVVPNL